ncbi:MAG TPA: alpha/beta hydrolase [Bauldia sp.]|nr:alpha/beta hydrolase [Bauldia sp.]
MAKASTPVEESAPATAVSRDVFYASADGLSLYAGDWGERNSPWTPVVCLPGLTRTTRDFDTLAAFLSTHRARPRRVVAFDYRGRGRSAWDRRRDGYNPVTETNDIFDGMAALNIPRAVIVGTSRGGIIGMLMGTMRPATVAALVLNDIGPAVEARGLARLKTYVGRTPIPDDWRDASRIQRRLHGGAFTAWDEADWDQFARLTYTSEAGAPKSDYDPALAQTLAGVEFDQPIPALWDEFRALKDLPVLAIRGANSDLLSAETLAEMARAHARVETVVIPNEGHAPLLRGALLSRIAAFIAAAEGSEASPDAIVAKEPPTYDLDAPSSN